MPIDWTLHTDAYDTVTVRGQLTWKEFEHLHETVEDPPGADRSLNTLVVLDGFEGWDKADGWGELKYVERNERVLRKLAVVGEAQWREQWEMFLLKGLSTIEIEYFTPDQIRQARHWLESD